MIKRVYNHSAKVLNFEFLQNEEDFIIDEQSIKFSNSGNHLILKVEKVNTETLDLVETLAKFLNVYSSEIGYAGFKDKKTTATQYLSISRKYSAKLKFFNDRKIKILDTFLHNKKLNIGDLVGNRFKINLRNTTKEDVKHIQRRLKMITKDGLLNYFSYQKLGKDIEVNLEKAKDLINGDLIINDKSFSKKLIMTYQSSFFNQWLANRTKKSKEIFDLLDGDVFLDKETNNYFISESINEKLKRTFYSRACIPTGLLPGKKVFKAIGKAREIEKIFDDLSIKENGFRREAIVFPKNVNCKYDEENKKCTLEFVLPKDSYATVLIENLANKNFSV